MIHSVCLTSPHPAHFGGMLKKHAPQFSIDTDSNENSPRKIVLDMVELGDFDEDETRPVIKRCVLWHNKKNAYIISPLSFNFQIQLKIS